MRNLRIINEWLMRCNLIRQLDFDSKYLINNNIKTSEKKLIPPISIYKLESNYRNLYLSLLDQKVVTKPRRREGLNFEYLDSYEFF